MASFNIQSNTTANVKYDSPTDIPRLQLWLDAADASKTTLGVAGFKDWSCYFNGNTQVRVDHHADLTFESKDFYLSFWVFLTELTSTGTLFWKHSNTSPQNFQLIKNGNTLRLWLKVTDSSAGWTFSNLPVGNLSIGWQQIEVTRNGSPLSIYINRTRTWDSTIGYYSFVDDNGPINIGSTSLNNSFISNVILRISDSFGSGLLTSLDNRVPVPLNQSFTTLQLLTRSSTLQDYSPTPKTVFYSSGDASSSISPNVIASWTDKSSFGAVASLPSSQAPFAPVLISSENKSLSTLRFNGTNQFLRLSRSIPISSDYSCFFVYNRPTAGTLSVSLGRFSSPNTPATALMQWYDNQLYGSNTYASTTVSSSAGILVASTASNQSFYINNIKLNNLTNWGVTTNNASVSTVGVYTDGNGSYYHNNAMGEIILTYAKLPDWELEFINNKLITKWQ